MQWFIARRPSKIVQMKRYFAKAQVQLEHIKVSLRAKVEHPLRVIKRQFGYTKVRYREGYRLVTNLLDPEQALARELAALYHERWEIEGVFDEFKTHLRTARCCAARRPSWSSRSCGADAGALCDPPTDDAGGLDSDILSFVHAVRVIKRKMPQAAAIPPERLARWRDALLEEIAVSNCGRLNPRGVKRKMSPFNVRHRSAALHRRHQP